MSYRQLETIIEEMLLKSFGVFVRHLPREDRAIFSLYLEGWTADQISLKLGTGLTVSEVHSSICRVKNEIKSCYSKASEGTTRRVRSIFNS